MSPCDANGPKPRPSPSSLWHRDVGLLVGVWLFMASTFVVGGAYDTDEFALLHRIVFWLLVAALVVFQPVLLGRAFSRFAPTSLVGAWLSALGAVLVAIPVIAIEVHLLKATPLLPRAADPWIEFLPFVGAPVVIVASFVLFLRFAWERRYLEARAPASQPASSVAPSPIGPETLYVRSQDHYLEFKTDHGRRFIRGRLADLKAGGEPWGFSPHRSWWVADRAVTACQRAGRDLQLLMSDGTRVPVSRAQQDTVRSRRLHQPYGS